MKKKLSIATWNVRTLLDLKDADRPQRQTALVARELDRYNIDIAALQETRLEGQGTLQEKNHTFFWIGKEPGIRREAGVGFAIANSLVKQLPTLPTGISERLITLRIPIGKTRYATVISAYAPTMTNPDQAKEEFYELLGQTLQKIPSTDKVIILGDFNARVGDDSTSWPIALGKFGRDKSNSNGEQLLSICTQFKLAITNTFFKMPEHWYYSWQHPRSKRCHLIDYIITRRVDLADIRSTRAMRGADCSTDHYLIRSLCNFHIKPPRRKTGPTPVKKLNVSKLADSKMQALLMTNMEANMTNLPCDGTINDQWENLCEKVYQTSVDTLGHTARKHQDWFDENDEEILSLLDERRRAHDALLSQQTRSRNQRYAQAKSKLQKKLRAMQNAWWDKKADELQQLADENSSKGFFAAIKQIYGPQKTAIAPVRNAEGSQVFTEKPEIVSRWREYFSELLNRPTTATEEALATIEQHPTQEDIANPPTLEEIVAAIKSTKSGKTPGLDGLPAEIYKYGGEALHTQLLKFYRTCWTAKELPQQFKDALIIAIYKKKGDRSDCGNYRGISLLSTAGKILAKILLKRLQTIAELILPESQCGFRTSRSTIDMIFTLRQLQEKAVEQQQSLYMIFIDLSKAFDTVDRSTLWILLRRYGCPETFVKLIQEFHDGMAGSVSVGGTITDPFEISHGLKQGCVLAPTLFTLFLGAVLSAASEHLSMGVFIRTRTEGQLFNLARLRANTKTRELCIRELLFADDAAIVAHTLEDIKEICKHFEQAATLFGLTISTKKTVTLHQPPPGQTSTSPHIEIYGTPLKSVNNFTYLGSTIASDNTIDMEINNRIRAASGAFGGLWKRVWSQHGIAISTKCKVYKAVVLPTLLYSAETYTLYRRHIRKLSQVHLRHLRQILRISWKDHISNIDVLRQANMSSIEAILTAVQLRWTGHVTRMSSDRLPKAVFYGELSSGKRLRGGQRLRYKDVLKRHLKTTHIPVNTWEPIAHDRQKWRRAIHQGKTHIEEKLTQKYIHEHNRRHGLLGASIPTVFCDDCGRGFVAQIGLNSHRRAKHKDTPLH